MAGSLFLGQDAKLKQSLFLEVVEIKYIDPQDRITLTSQFFEF